MWPQKSYLSSSKDRNAPFSTKHNVSQFKASAFLKFCPRISSKCKSLKIVWLIWLPLPGAIFQ